jgi:nucleoid-associated protein YgaU
MASFDQLKAKYQSVLQVIQDEQVSVKNLHLQDDKLFIKGVAPSLDAANKVWDEIKRVNPSADDITADFPVDTSMQVQQPQQTEQKQEASNVRKYTVKSGDTLSKISKQFYGSANDYMKIFNANKDQLSDPDKISVGQELKIPAA